GSAGLARPARVQGGPEPDDFALARYLPDGQLDTSFNGTGRLATDFGGEDHVNGLAIQDDGRIVAAGRTTIGVSQFALARYLKNGRLDQAFGSGGRVTNDFGTSAAAAAVAVQKHGRRLPV